MPFYVCVIETLFKLPLRRAKGRVKKKCRGNGDHSFVDVLLFMELTFNERRKPQKSQLCNSLPHVFIEGA